ncbi:hypothetical protein L6452_34168 [Arctium lappa]|uniref:Uncharacterized protein n=1 Tax=Arctium lappa TaxID=4217 RepID=A0ACB8YJ20_ARCLA|nr:hypothetical protein L6452_34168 [Arctium lappa]
MPFILQKMEKMLVVVVDGSKNLARYWDDIRTVLESIVRKFCANHSSTSLDPFEGRYNLNLVVNAAEDGSSAQSVSQFDSPQNMDSFLDSLSRLNFNDYGYLGNSGVIEGISKALMMFPSTRKRTQSELMGKRHCILVTASHPYPCPKEVLIPTNQILESGEVVEVTIDNVLADAETVAQSLAEGNQNNPGSLIMNFKHPQLLLLISEQFSEAREALKEFEAENNYDTNSQLDPLDLFAESFSVEDLMLLENIISNPLIERDDAMPIATEDEINAMFLTDAVDEGFNTLTSNNLWPFEATPSNFSLGSIGINPNYEQKTMTNFVNSQMNDCFGKFPDMPIPEGTGTSTSADQLRQRTIPNENNNFHFSTPWLEKYDPNHMLEASSSKSFVAVNTSQHLEGETHNPLMLNFQHKADRVASLRNSTGSGTKTSSSVFEFSGSRACVVGSSGILNSKMPPHFYGGTSASMGASNSKNVLTSNNAHVTRNNASRTKYVPSTNTKTIGIGSSRKRIRNDVLSSNAQKTSINTSRARTRDVASATKIALPSSSSHLKEPQNSRATPLPKLKDAKIPNAKSSDLHPNNLSSEAPSDYVKAWEGSLTSRGSGDTVFMSKIVAYRQPSVPQKNFENWPKVMQLKHLLSHAQIGNR